MFTHTCVFCVGIVLDENDNAPIFTLPSYSFTIPENTDQLVGVGVAAMDSDVGINSEITYSIVNGNDDYTFVLGEKIQNGPSNPLSMLEHCGYL